MTYSCVVQNHVEIGQSPFGLNPNPKVDKFLVNVIFIIRFLHNAEKNYRFINIDLI